MKKNGENLEDFLKIEDLKKALEMIGTSESNNDFGHNSLLQNKLACRHLCELFHLLKRKAPESKMQHAIERQETEAQLIVWQEECFELGKKIYEMIIHFQGQNSLLVYTAMTIWEPYLQKQISEKHIPDDMLEDLYKIVSGPTKYRLAELYFRRIFMKNNPDILI